MNADQFADLCRRDERESVCSPRWLVKQTTDELRAMHERSLTLWPGEGVAEWQATLAGALASRGIAV